MAEIEANQALAEGAVLKERFCIQQVIGAGGFATTYRALDRSTQQPCVVKEIQLNRLKDPKAEELFEREGQVLAKLQHPRIPKFIDYFEEVSPRGFHIYLVQEFIEGRNLAELVRGGRHFTEADVIQTALAVTAVLEYLHGRNPPVIHRDIKPSNVMVNASNEVFLIDFGAVREKVLRDSQTETGGSTFVGTYGYIPYEQYGARALPASDVFSLGMTLIHLLSHKEPGDLEHSGMRYDFRPHVNVSERFAAVLEKTIAPNWEDRYQSAAALRADLEAVLAGKAPLLPGLPAKPRRHLSRRLVLLALVALACGVWAWFWTGPKKLTGFKTAVTSLAFSPDGKHLVTCAEKIQFWRTSDWGEQTEIQLNPFVNPFVNTTGRINALTFSRDGAYFAAASAVNMPEGGEQSGSATVWRTSDWKRLHDLNSPHPVDSLAFTPDAKHLLTTANHFNKNTRRCLRSDLGSWDLSKQYDARWYAPFADHMLRSIGISSDGTCLGYVIAFWNRDIAEYNPAQVALEPYPEAQGRTPKLINSDENPPLSARCVVFSPAGRVFAVGYNGYEVIRLYELPDRFIGTPNRPILFRHYSYAAYAGPVFSPDGSLVAAPESRSENDATVREIVIWNVSPPIRERARLPVKSRVKGFLIQSLAWSPDGRLLAAGLGNSFKGEVLLFDVSDWAGKQ